jgi:hypothetical protein
MTNAAWAFVRPYEITKGALAAQEAQNKQDKFEVDMAQAQEQTAYLAQQRALALEQQRQTLDYTKQLNPLQIQQQSINLSNQGMVNANNTESFQQNQWRVAADKLLQVDQNPGDKEDVTFKAMLSRVESVQDPNIKFQAVQMLKDRAMAMMTAALNKGDAESAQNIALYMSNGPVPTTAAIGAMSPTEKLNWANNRQVTGAIPDPKIAMEILKFQNDVKLKQVPTGDAQNKLVMDEANRTAPMTVAKAQELYAQHLENATKNGMKAMTLEEFFKMLQRPQVGQAPGNSVSSTQRNPQGPGGVPYR